MVLGTAVADVRDGVGVDGDAAGRATEGVVAVVAENLIRVILPRKRGAEGIGGDDGGVVHEVAVAAFIDGIVFDFIDPSAGEVVEPQVAELG